MHVLVFSVDRERLGIARLPKALQQVGFKVGVLCHPLSFLAKTGHVDQRFLLSSTKSGRQLLRSLVQAIHEWHPVIIIPGDEIAVCFLHYLVRLGIENPSFILAEALTVIQRSLGNAKLFEATVLKHHTQLVAQELGLQTPMQKVVRSLDEALEFASKYNYPVVLKKDFSWSGAGVKVCDSQDELLQSLPAFLPRKKSRFRKSVSRLLNRSWLLSDNTLSVQQFIGGKAAMYSAVAVSGEILTGFAAAKECTSPTPNGPSSVVRFIEHPEMAATASALIAHFEYTGFAGFDFMLSEEGHAYFIECNPRPIPVSHLGSSVGRDLCAALYAKLSGGAYTQAPTLQGNALAALFPQEWYRDVQSPHLEKAYHDVPWDDPALFKACIG
ncbi:ATP-grasp domain-containing protein [Leptolyngbya sp. FACHB-261]|uniref:ATP-binding protein n=1 Tax=Leptolyngbya sp. FACHB-261 TaxID=2692806 RepID=UPI0016856C54|nr:ATP-grasp domain-containing protein [Leptolyngbya sp. FACHB-261]MBD2105156.1 ATP-grasp domain-containing protein [Leptolyngbya sp. FACHB-261]